MESVGVTDILAWLTAIFFALAYRLFFRACNYWETQKVITSNSSLIAGLSAKQLHQTERKNYTKYGRIYGRYDWKMPVLTVGDPDVLKEIVSSDAFPNRRDIRFGDEVMDRMVSSLEGSDWDRVHRIVSKCFTSAKLAAMSPKIRACTEVLCNNIDLASREKGTVNVVEFVSCYMIDIIGNCIFGAGIKSNENPNNPFVVHTKKLLLSEGFNWKGFLVVHFPRVMKWFNISLFNSEGTLFFKNFIHEWLQICKLEHKENDVSFLKFVTEVEKSEVCDDQVTNTMSEDELAAQCCIFFMAGYHATSSTLSSALYSLAVNQNVQQKLYEEIKESELECDTGDLEGYINVVQNMKYLDAVLNETLRMYPPTVRTERRAERDYTISGLNVSLQKGMLVSIPIYAMHHDPEWYPEPEEFNPDRFYKTDDRLTNSLRLYKENWKFVPFGQGKRICIGMRFALFQLKLGLVRLISKYRFYVCSETQVPLELTSEYALLKPTNLILGVEQRCDS